MLKIIHFSLIFTLLAPSFALAQSKSLPETSTHYYQNIDDSEFESYEANAIVIYDPMERFNRKIFSFNEAFDIYFFEHFAKFYRNYFPDFFRKSVRNFLVNLSLPISAANSLAQGKTDNGLATISNFLINSTIGILGIFDVAGQKNLHYIPEDFGQTLGHYGMNSGTYIMLPFLGPSSGRDFLGLAVDRGINPLGFNALKFGGETNFVDENYRIGLTVASGIDTRESLIDIIDNLRQDSFDSYATIRSAYLQKRAAEIKN
jgi:phospholipid-binding lipoprotein MlaA